jgi:hypothetical protein
MQENQKRKCMKPTAQEDNTWSLPLSPFVERGSGVHCQNDPRRLLRHQNASPRIRSEKNGASQWRATTQLGSSLSTSCSERQSLALTRTHTWNARKTAATVFFSSFLNPFTAPSYTYLACTLNSLLLVFLLFFFSINRVWQVCIRVQLRDFRELTTVEDQAHRNKMHEIVTESPTKKSKREEKKQPLNVNCGSSYHTHTQSQRVHMSPPKKKSTCREGKQWQRATSEQQNGTGTLWCTTCLTSTCSVKRPAHLFTEKEKAKA